MATPVSASTESIIKRFEQPSKVILGLDEAGALAFNSKNQIIVTDAGGNRVSILTPAGEKISSFGSEGSGDGQFQNIDGVAVDKDDNIYTVESANNRVQKFSSEGKFIGKAGSSGTSELQFDMPLDVIYNRNDNLLYIADQLNARIQVLTTDFSFVRQFGGDTTSPTGLAYDGDNNIYASDYNLNAVAVYTATGDLLHTYGEKPNDGEIFEPTRIAVDGNKLLFVNESGEGCLTVFNSKGEFVTSFKDGVECYGLAVDKNNTLFVSTRSEILVYN